MKRKASPWRHEPHWKDFQMQRKNADRRGIKWELTYPEWLKIWQRSGHFEKRGRKSLQYCMARKGDKGSYIIENVEIVTNQENHLYRNLNYKHSQEAKNKIGFANSQRVISEETRRKIGAASKGRKGCNQHTKR